MNLLIDIGNTRIKYVIEENGILSAIYHCNFEDIMVSISKHPSFKKILVVSVSNQKLADELALWAQNEGIRFEQVATQKESFGILNSYINYNQMGADRWLAIVGAEGIFPKKNILVVDSGTATTFDLLCADKKHLGGWIIPGIDMMMNSLFSNTDKVIGEKTNLIGTSLAQTTSDNVNNGSWAATLGSIEIAKQEAKIKGVQIDKIIFTGGNGKKLQALYKGDSYFSDELIFIGLKQFLNKC